MSAGVALTWFISMFRSMISTALPKVGRNIIGGHGGLTLRNIQVNTRNPMFVSQDSVRFQGRRFYFVAALVGGVFLATAAQTSSAAEFTAIHLWEKGAPGSPATKPKDEPEFYVKLPTAPSNGTAVIILPGGG